MVKDIFASLKLSSNNLHLKNIFTSDAYLELGNIDYDVIKRMLNFEIINIKEVASFFIQNMGIGKSTLPDEEIRNKLPYLFFKNLTDKDGLKQLFITYGILKYTNSDKKEIFMPILLLPIEIYFEEMEVFFQLMYRPIENPLIASTFTEFMKSNISLGEKFNSIYAMDEFCLSFNRASEFSVELENYLTFANLKKRDTLIDFTKFQDAKEFDEKLANHLYTDEIQDYYYSLPLNKTQREILMNAILGKSFSIVGRYGSGKTTVLKDIAINAIYRENRVLYISDAIETLNDVKETMVQKQLINYLADFSQPFFKLANQIIETSPRKYNSVMELKDDLLERYQKIDQYEKAMNGRIANFRFTEILDELSVLVDKPRKALEIEKVTDLYKHEYLDVKKSLEKIQSSLMKMVSFKESVWKEIPIINQIKYPNQIITLIYQIDKCFRTFLEEKNYLEKNFGINKIENYAMLKNIIYYLENLEISSVPKSWIEESLVTFREAQNEYKNLKSDVYKLQEIRYYIEHKYIDVDTIKIDEEINTILGEYFTGDSLDNIDKLNADRKNITIKINKGTIQKEIFEKTAAKITAFSEWEFLNSDESIGEVIRFVDFVNEFNINRKWINVIINNQYSSMQSKLLKLIENIDVTRGEIEEFHKEFPKLDNNECKETLQTIADIIKNDSNKEKNKAFHNIRKKYDNIKIEVLTEKIAKYLENIKRFKELKDQYYDLVRLKYDPKNNVLGKLESLKKYVEGIGKKEYRSRIIKMLYKLVDKETNVKEEHERIIRTLLMFKKSYNELNELFITLEKYDLPVKGQSFLEKTKNVSMIFDYIQNLFLSNDRMLYVVRANDFDYVKAETYFAIKKALEEREKYSHLLDSSEKYQRIYGELYDSSKTDIQQISRVIQNFVSYFECFSNNESFIKSLDINNNRDLRSHLENCKEYSGNLTETFKMYCKIFKDGISRYYYSDFIETIDYTTKLLNSKEELLTYLAITEGISILNKYKLNKLIKYIITLTKSETLVTDFCYLYMSGLKDIYLDRNRIIDEIKNLKEYLQEIRDLENHLIEVDGENILSDIRKYSSHRFNLNGIKNLDYQAYIRRTKGLKHIFLANTKFVDRYLNTDDFDLIIIDDAHILSPNQQFINSVNSQVIISGEYQLHASISNNLISIIRNTQKFNLSYRYDLTPKNLMNYMVGQRGINHHLYSKNIGLEIVEKKINQYIFELYENNKKVKINYFLKDLGKRRKTYEDLSKILISNNFQNKEIISFFLDNLSISDLTTGYLVNSDYNIIDLEDYQMIDIDYISANMLDSLLLCRQKVVIYDSKKLLQTDVVSKFTTGIKSILDGRNHIFNEEIPDRMRELLAEEIRKYDFEVFTNNGNIDLILKKGDSLFGVLILFDDINRSEIMNIYREEYVNAIKNNWKVITISKVLFGEGIKKVATTIIEALKNE